MRTTCPGAMCSKRQAVKQKSRCRPAACCKCVNCSDYPVRLTDTIDTTASKIPDISPGARTMMQSRTILTINLFSWVCAGCSGTLMGIPTPHGCWSPTPHTDIPASGSHLQTYPRHKKNRWQLPAASLPHFVLHCLSIPPVNRRLHSTFSRGLRQGQRIARDQFRRRNVVHRSGWVL